MWQTPKIDWEIKPLVNGRYQGDWFNVEDYNRIIGNLRYLHAAGQNIYSVVFSLLGMKTKDRAGIPLAGDINALEESLYRIVSNTFAPPNYTGKKTWLANGATPTVDDLNRIERACKSIYEDLTFNADYKAYVPSGSTGYVTSDGKSYMVL